MIKEVVIWDEEVLRSKIYRFRGLQVMLDKDLAELYGVTLKRLNEQVKRNIRRFPEFFMFQLNDHEWKSLRSQIATLENTRGKHRKYSPYVFTEQGVTMLSSVLNSDIAIETSIKIIEVFISMRKFIMNNANIFSRLDQIETKQLEYKIESNDKFEKIFKAIESKDVKPKQGIFFDGQIFDAYLFVSDLIKSAKNSIVLIDNYIDETVLALLSKRKENCNVLIYTQNISRQLKLDLERYNTQYPSIEIKIFRKSHDRFLIIDDKDVYHIGASLKDLGKKWFGFSKFEKEAVDLLGKLK